MNEAVAPPIVGTVNDVVVEAIECGRCGRSLLGLKVGDSCPGCHAAVHEAIGLPSVDDAFCIQCGYALRGLREGGACPECGTPISKSLRGDLLGCCSLDYVRSLRRGAWMVLASIAVQFVLLLGIILTAVLAGAAPLATPAVDLAMSIAGLVVEFGSLYGWWLLSALDPAYSGRDDGATSRKVLRWALVFGAIYAMGDFVVQMLPGATPNQAMGWIEVATAMAALAVMAVQFFASMIYLRWIARRVPDRTVHERARRFMWLGPLLMTVGILCVGIGPIIAIVMYWNMIYWLYKDLRRIEHQIAIEETAVNAAVDAI